MVNHRYTCLFSKKSRGYWGQPVTIRYICDYEANKPSIHFFIITYLDSMKRIISAIALLALTLSAPALGQFFKSKAAKAKEAAAAASKNSTNSNSDYAKLTKDAVKREGLFTTHFTKDGRLFFEMPESAFSAERRYLLSNRIASTSNSKDFVAGQMATTPLLLRFSKDENRVFMHLVQNDDIVQGDDPIMASYRKNFVDPILKAFKIVAKNGKNVLIDVTAFFATNESSISPLMQDNPMSVLFGGGKALKGPFMGDASGITSVKSFPQNIEIKSSLTFQIPALEGPYTVGVHRSLFVLPEKPMAMRLQDNRVGYFSSSKRFYSSNTDKVESKTFIERWRLEPKPEDRDAYFRGELVEPAKPIVYYVDTAFPAKWRSTIRQGIEDWNKAFEVAGFKNAIRALDYPSNDPDFDPDDMRYSCFKYALTSTANAMGPSHVDPRSGEILTGDVIWYHNILSLLHNWRFTQTAAVDPRTHKAVFDDEVMKESIRYAAAHEIGHTLGLMHNFVASYSYPTDSLRSPSFTQKYGTTPSIMDYARNNFVAQPGDLERGVSLTPPVLGVYDIYAINWGYRLVPGATTPQSEKPTLDKWIAEKAHDPMYAFGAQQVFATIDPTAQSEDLSNDHFKSADYAIKNLKVIMQNLEQWTAEKGATYEDVAAMYNEVVMQYARHFRHALPYLGGIMFKEIRQGDNNTEAATYVDRDTQRKALKWVLNEARTYNKWLSPQALLAKLDLPSNTNQGLVKAVAGALFAGPTLHRISEGALRNPKANYSLEAYLDEAMRELFKPTIAGSKLQPEDLELQNAAIELFAKASGLSADGGAKKIAALEAYDQLMDISHSCPLPCAHAHNHETSFVRINFNLPSLPPHVFKPLMAAQLKRVLTWYRSALPRTSDAATRAYYEYQILQIERQLKNK